MPTVVTPEMVGKLVAVFASPEVKGALGTPEPEQINWVNMVRGFGGLAGFVKTQEDLTSLLKR